MSEREQPYVILVAVEFDETGDRALQTAIGLAKRYKDAELNLVHVVRDAGGVNDAASELLALNVRLERVPEQLQQRVEAIRASTPVKLTAHIRSGAVVRSILQTAADLDADLLVLGTHKRTGIEKLVLGSVAERVLKEAHCPVLVAMPKDHEGARRAASVEPPCPDCVAARRTTGDQTHWCDRHSRSRLRPHVYEPSSDRISARPAGL